MSDFLKLFGILNSREYEKAEREWKEAEASPFAWGKLMTVDVPAEIAAGKVLKTKQVTGPVIFMVQSVRDAATNARDRILAQGILSIMEELENREFKESVEQKDLKEGGCH